MKNQPATLDELAGFDSIIDVRTPQEFAEDHIPGAINAPVLSDSERVTIGTLYKTSPFEATRLGAALVAQNIAHHLQTRFADKPMNWRPVIYCWRGGKRSGAMTTWFKLIGWKAKQLDGGYKTYRRHVLAQLDTLPHQFHFLVLAGLTGCGKTRLLCALQQSGAQTLDLEALARHRGSLLGALPGEVQPSQKQFESQLVARLKQLDPAQPVFIEAESKRIGQLRLPDSLQQALSAADCIRVEADLADRVAFLCADYANLFDDPAAFQSRLSRLTELHGKQTLAHWLTLITQHADAELFQALIEQHYDPAYLRSSHSLYPKLPAAPRFHFRPNAKDLLAEARRLLAMLQIS